MRVAVPCRLPEDQARARVEKCLTELKEKYAGRIGDVRIDWHGNSAGLCSSLFSSRFRCGSSPT